MIFLLFKMVEEFRFHLKCYQSKWARGTQPLSCTAHFSLKSGREELVSGFELAICQLRFEDRICLFTDHFKQLLWNLQIKTFLLLEFLSSGKPQSFCLHSNSTNRLYLTPKSVKLYTNVLHLDSFLAPNPQWGEGEGGGLKALPKELLPKFHGSLLKRQFEPWVSMWSQAGSICCVLFI